jgi:hypothetical protein
MTLPRENAFFTWAMLIIGCLFDDIRTRSQKPDEKNAFGEPINHQKIE